MTLTYQNNRYEALTTFAERHLPKAAAFRWDKDARRWWTSDGASALKMIEFADPSTAARLQAVQATLDASRATTTDVEIPCPTGRAYFPYQKAGIAFCLDKPGALIADEMGLGKTIQAIGVINADASIRRVLVVCPARLRLNWKREFGAWLTRPLSVGICASGLPATDVVIINYDILAKHEAAIRMVTWDLLVVDECHRVKNPEAQRSQQVYGSGMARKAKRLITPIPAKRRVYLTGTPVLNRPVELWPIVAQLDPHGMGRSFFGFAKRYCGAYQDAYAWHFDGASNTEELQDKLRSTIMVRRLKADVLADLPPKTRNLVVIPANGAAGVIERERRAHGSDFAQAVQNLDSVNTAFESGALERHDMGVAKIPHVIEHLEETLENGGKVICFAHHHDVIDALAAHFGAQAVVVDGRVSQKAGQLAVDRFQTDASVRLFLGNIQAAGVGLTLTASTHVVFAEQDWTPGNMVQAEDRAHRIGQRGNVTIDFLVFEDSLDAHLAQTWIEKQAVADAVLDNTGERAAHVAEAKLAVNAEMERAKAKVAAETKARAANDLGAAQMQAIHLGLRILAGVCDGARSLDDVGFNGVDTHFGKQLAAQASLSFKQALAARRMLTKYKRQLGSELVERMFDRKEAA